MAQHNPASRTFLLIVLAGIVIGFAIAFFFLKGDDGDKGAQIEKTEQPPAAAEQPPSTPPAAEAPVEIPTEGMSDDLTPPDEMPIESEGIDTDGMSDGVTPPDEMIDELLPGEAPDATNPEQVPDSPDTTPSAPNP